MFIRFLLSAHLRVLQHRIILCLSCFCFFVIFCFCFYVLCFSFFLDRFRHVFRFPCLTFFLVSLSGAMLIFVVNLNLSVRFFP